MSDLTAALAERLVGNTKAAKVMLATAESCTAGRLATLLADAPGGGDQFHGGFVVYTKENKTAVLGVPNQLIANYTAVGGAVAEAMASDGNPVGLMHIAVALRGKGIHHRSHRSSGSGPATPVMAMAMSAGQCSNVPGFQKVSREELRTRAIHAALELADKQALLTVPQRPSRIGNRNFFSCLPWWSSPLF